MNDRVPRHHSVPNAPDTVVERLRQLECDPIAGMVALAMDGTLPAELRGRLFAQLATYVAPRRRATDMTGTEGGPLAIETWLDTGALSDEDLGTLIDILERTGGAAP